jgi:hypothetical protein
VADLSLEWNADFQPTATGDLLLCDGDTQAEQRIVRRLLTAVQGYIFHPEFGAGLPQRIGRPGRVSSIKAIVKSQLTLESAVNPRFQSTVSVAEPTPGSGLFVISISFQSRSGKQVSLSFDTGS